jgi:hypothetical protein
MSGMRSGFVGVIFALAIPAFSQLPLQPAALKLANHLLESPTPNSLHCEISGWKPFFDFSFRFEIGFIARCEYRQFQGIANHLTTLVRARPLDGNAQVMGESFEIPTMPASMREQIDIKKFRGELEFSGAIACGEGDYAVEVLIADDRERIYRKQWRAKAHRHGAENKAIIRLAPGEIAPLLLGDLKDQPANQQTRNVTVLLHAAPIYPFSRKLHAWDRAFLIGSLSSLSSQVPTASFRVIAFNADQQKEIFSTSHLNRAEMARLSRKLAELELGTISYRNLQQPTAWVQTVNRIMEKELHRKSAPDAVVFLGPQMRYGQHLGSEAPACAERNSSAVFYLEYEPFIGQPTTDALSRMTKDCGGRVLGFHSPGELASAIQKIRAVIDTTETR